MAQMTEHFKAPEIIQLSSEQIANLSDAQFKTLVIRTLTELVEFGHKLDEKMKAILRETKENVQEPIVMRRKLGLKSTVWTRRKKETSNQKRMKQQATFFIRKNEERLRNLQDIFKRSNIRIIGVPEGEEEEQKIENLFGQIMKETSLIWQRK